ncbi:hypothetical protein GCM10009007_19310 [Formosimonas limnophila]|uniref:Defence against restriction A N-terminal domain-containing protein n=1 Tax=Formosimonas limnophila TaxID=1384487 RepID=A0A8J3CP08_9BURK|nr:hypothetical protein [Formosimonas limnophila]GHA78426.1 hypothetical protein GCM10009007_19310 [Formosimonas limnophila]
MPSPNFIFDFDKMGTQKDAATKNVVKYFAQASCPVVSANVSTTKRTSGVSYREMSLTFADSQNVIFQIKSSGDIFKVKLNGKDLAIRAQDDQLKAIAQITDRLAGGRSAFQAKLAKAMAATPAEAGLKSTVKTIEAQLIEQIAALDEAIAEVQGKLAAA